MGYWRFNEGTGGIAVRLVAVGPTGDVDHQSVVGCRRPPVKARRESACRGVRGARRSAQGPKAQGVLGSSQGRRFKTQASGSCTEPADPTAGIRRQARASDSERATRTERAGEAARESACRGVRGARRSAQGPKAQGVLGSSQGRRFKTQASGSCTEPADPTAGIRRQARASDSERATRTERAGEAARESACRGVRGARRSAQGPKAQGVLGSSQGRRFKTQASGSCTEPADPTAGIRRQARASDSERATRTERAGEAARESACRGVRGAKPLG